MVARCRVLLMFGTLVVLAVPELVDGALAQKRTNVPTRYRYAGAVINGRGVPAHQIATGEGIRFFFFDALSQGRKSTRYRLCVGLTGRPPARCWNRGARYGIGKVVFPFVLPAEVPLGELTARWLVAGRTVATWSFLYVRGGG